MVHISNSIVSVAYGIIPVIIFVCGDIPYNTENVLTDTLIWHRFKMCQIQVHLVTLLALFSFYSFGRFGALGSTLFA